MGLGKGFLKEGGQSGGHQRLRTLGVWEVKTVVTTTSAGPDLDSIPEQFPAVLPSHRVSWQSRLGPTRVFPSKIKVDVIKENKKIKYFFAPY